MAIHPSRYHAVAYRLPRLPRELVHEVLNDLSLSKILELICNHKLPYIDECVSSHIRIGKLLPPALLAEAKEYFFLHIDICSARRSNPHPQVASLNHDAQFLLAESKPVNFLAVIKAAILKDLYLYGPYFPVLQQFASEPIPDRVHWDTESPAALRRVFENINAAEVKMNSIKSGQLKKLAELLEKYPNLLRTCCERFQEPRRNITHRVEWLRLQADKMVHRQILENRFVARSLFTQKQFYLIPYDRVLRAFLKTLQRYPPHNAIQEDGDKQTKRTPRPKTKITPHHYPEHLDIPFVLSGFAHQNPRSSDEKEHHPPPRVIHTKYSCGKLKNRGGEDQPSFYVYDQYPSPKKIKKWVGLCPMPQKEFEWLEAFIATCVYMSEMQEEWSKEQTVSQYWKAHV